MADEPENLVLVQLREIRAKLEKLDVLEKRFDQLDERFDELRGHVAYSLGLGTMSDLRARDMEARRDAEVMRLKRAEERLEEHNKRLARLEEMAN